MGLNRIGGDPEFWVLNEEGTPVGAFEFFPGTKEEPFPLDGGSVQVDGFAVEIGIDPSENADEFDDKVRSLITQCSNFIPNDYSFNFSPVMEFPKEYFDAAPITAKVLGCAPSYDLYTGKIQPPPEVSQSNIRYAGGHIHVGWTKNLDVENDMIRSLILQRAMNISYYLSDTLDGPYSDKVYQRLDDYKCEYSVRIKPYGIEYRRPSSWWAEPSNISGRKRLATTVFNALKEA